MNTFQFSRAFASNDGFVSANEAYLRAIRDDPTELDQQLIKSSFDMEIPRFYILEARVTFSLFGGRTDDKPVIVFISTDGGPGCYRPDFTIGSEVSIIDRAFRHKEAVHYDWLQDAVDISRRGADCDTVYTVKGTRTIFGYAEVQKRVFRMSITRLNMPPMMYTVFDVRVVSKCLSRTSKNYGPLLLEYRVRATGHFPDYLPAYIDILTLQTLDDCIEARNISHDTNDYMQKELNERRIMILFRGIELVYLERADFSVGAGFEVRRKEEGILVPGREVAVPRSRIDYVALKPFAGAVILYDGYHFGFSVRAFDKSSAPGAVDFASDGLTNWCDSDTQLTAFRECYEELGFWPLKQHSAVVCHMHTNNGCMSNRTVMLVYVPSRIIDFNRKDIAWMIWVDPFCLHSLLEFGRIKNDVSVFINNRDYLRSLSNCATLLRHSVQF